MMMVVMMMMMMMVMMRVMTIVSVEQRPGWGEHVLMMIRGIFIHFNRFFKIMIMVNLPPLFPFVN